MSTDTSTLEVTETPVSSELGETLASDIQSKVKVNLSLEFHAMANKFERSVNICDAVAREMSAKDLRKVVVAVMKYPYETPSNFNKNSQRMLFGHMIECLQLKEEMTKEALSNTRAAMDAARSTALEEAAKDAAEAAGLTTNEPTGETNNV